MMKKVNLHLNISLKYFHLVVEGFDVQDKVSVGYIYLVIFKIT